MYNHIMKKVALSVFAAALFLAGCAADVMVRRNPPAGETVRVAVLPCKSHPSSPGSGELAYEAFSTNILHIKGYSVVDRGAIDQLIKEQKLTQTGVIDQTQAIELGKLLGAQGVILGTVTEYVPRKSLMFPPAKVSVTARLINTKTGEVEWTASKTCGGAKRWLTWLIWPIGLVATFTSPSAEDQIQNSGRAIFRTLEKKIEKAQGQ